MSSFGYLTACRDGMFSFCCIGMTALVDSFRKSARKLGLFRHRGHTLVGANKSRDRIDGTQSQAFRLESGPGAAVAPDQVARLTSAIRILRLTQVIQITGLQKTVIYALQATGEFPMRIRLTPRSVGWVEEEVQLWLAQRIAVSRSARPTNVHGNSSPKR